MCGAVANQELARQRAPSSSCSSWLQSAASTHGSNSRFLKLILSWKVLFATESLLLAVFFRPHRSIQLRCNLLLLLLLLSSIYYAWKQHITCHNYKDRKKHWKLKTKIHKKLETIKQITAWCASLCVCLSVCLSLCLLVISVSLAKMAEPIKMLFGVWTHWA